MEASILADGVSVRGDVVSDNLQAAVDWSMQELLVRIRKRPKVDDPLRYFARKLVEFANNQRDTITEEEKVSIEQIVENRTSRRMVVHDLPSAENASKLEPPSEDDQMNGILPHLKAQPFLKHLRDEVLLKIAGKMSLKTLKVGEPLCMAGEISDQAYIVKSGLCLNASAISLAPEKVSPKDTYTGMVCGISLLHCVQVPETIVASGQNPDGVSVWCLRQADLKAIIKREMIECSEITNNLLASDSFFQMLDLDEMRRLLLVCREIEYKENELIMVEGSQNTDNLFLVKEGSVEIERELGNHVSLERGEIFGEEGLLCTAGTGVRRASAKAKSGGATILALNRAAFDRMVGPMAELLKRDPKKYEEYEEDIDAIAVVARCGRRSRRDVVLDGNAIVPINEPVTSRGATPKVRKSSKKLTAALPPISIEALRNTSLFFQCMSDKERKGILKSMKRLAFEANATIIEEGELDERCFYVLEGEAISSNGQIFKAGCIFGEYNLVHTTPCTTTYTAGADGLTGWTIDKTTFKQRLYEVRTKNQNAWIKLLKAVRVLSILHVTELTTLCQAAEEVSIPPNVEVATKGEMGQHLYVLINGEAETVGAENTKTFKVGECFGEMNLMGEVSCKVTIMTKKESTFLRVQRDAFLRLLGPLRILITRSPKLYAEYDKAYQKTQAKLVPKVETKTREKE